MIGSAVGASAVGLATAAVAVSSAAAAAPSSPTASEEEGRRRHPKQEAVAAGTAHAAALAGSPLAQLFSHEPHKLARLLQAVTAAAAPDGAGRGWKGVIRVPPRLAPPDCDCGADAHGTMEAGDEEVEEDGAAVTPADGKAATGMTAAAGALAASMTPDSSAHGAVRPASPLGSKRGGAGPVAPGLDGAAATTADGVDLATHRTGSGSHKGQQPAAGSSSSPRRLRNPLRPSQDRRLTQHHYQHHQQQQQQQRHRCLSLPPGSGVVLSHKSIDTVSEDAQLCDDEVGSPCGSAIATAKLELFSGSSHAAGANAPAAAAAAGSSATGIRPAPPRVPCRPQSGVLSTSALAFAPYTAVPCRPHSGLHSWQVLRSHVAEPDSGASFVADSGAAAVAAETPRVVLPGLAPALLAPVSAAAAASAVRTFQPLWHRPAPASVDIGGGGGAATLSQSVYGSGGGGSAALLDAAGITLEHVEEALTAGSGPLATSVLTVTLSENPSLARTLSVRHLSYNLHAPLSYLRSSAGSSSCLPRPHFTAAPGSSATAGAAAPATLDMGSLVDVDPVSTQQLPTEPRAHEATVSTQQRPARLLLPMAPLPLTHLTPVSTPPPLKRQQHQLAPGGPPPQQVQTQGEPGAGGEESFARLLPRVAAPPAAQQHDGPDPWPRHGVRYNLTEVGSGGAGLSPSVDLSPPVARWNGAGVERGFGAVGFGSGPGGLGSDRPASLGSVPACRIVANAGSEAQSLAQAGDPNWNGRVMCSQLQSPAHPHTPILHHHLAPPPPQQQQQQCSRLESGSHGELLAIRGEDTRALRCSHISSSGGEGRTAVCSFVGAPSDVSPSWALSAAASPFNSTTPLSALVLPYGPPSPSTELIMGAAAAAAGGPGSGCGSAEPTAPASAGPSAEAAVAVAATGAQPASPASGPKPYTGDDSELAAWRKGRTLQMVDTEMLASALAASSPTAAERVGEGRTQATPSAVALRCKGEDGAFVITAAAAAAIIEASTLAGRENAVGLTAVDTFDGALAAPVVAAARLAEAENSLACGGRAGDEAPRGTPATDAGEETEWGVMATFRQSTLACGARSGIFSDGTGSGSDRDSPEALSLHAALGAAAAAAAADAAAQPNAVVTDGEAPTAAPVAPGCAAVEAQDAHAPLPQLLDEHALLTSQHDLPSSPSLRPTSWEQGQAQNRRCLEALLRGQALQQLPPQHQQRPESPRDMSSAPPPPLPPAPPLYLKPLPVARSLSPPSRAPSNAPSARAAPRAPSRPSSAALLIRSPSPSPSASASSLVAPGCCCWHRIIASPAVDPVSGRQVVVVMQDDVSGKVLLERRLGLLTETEHRLLEQLYPPHMLRHLADELVAQQAQHAQQIAQHAQQQQQQEMKQLEMKRRQSGLGWSVCPSRGGDANANPSLDASIRGGGSAPAVGAVGPAGCGKASLERVTMQHRRSSTAGGAGAGSCGGPSSSSQLLRLSPSLHDPSCTMATMHPKVTLLFADIKGFTPLCNEIGPREVMVMLNQLFSRFDSLLDKYGVRKVETIGDAYFVAGGLTFGDTEPSEGRAKRSGASSDPLRGGGSGGAAVAVSARAGSSDVATAPPAGPAADAIAAASSEDPAASAHAANVIGFAKAMLVAARHVAMPTSGQPVQIRVGVHSGPVVSGLLGSRMPRFCLFGTAVATAARMESTGEAGAVHISEETYSLLPGRERAGWKATPGVEVKGFGHMRTYLWRGQVQPAAAAAAAAAAPAPTPAPAAASKECKGW